MPLHPLVEKLITALPIFSRQMSALLVGPKTAVLQQDLESDSALGQALTFLAVSFGIAYIAQIPFLPDTGNKELLFGILAIQSALSFALNVVLVVMVWKLVGGKLSWRKVFIATCYFCGVTTILFLGILLIAAGAFRILDPVGYQQVMSGTVVDPAGMWSSAGYRAYCILLAVAFLATYVWIFCVWGAYRELMQRSRLRSAIALLLFVAFSPLLFAIQILMGATVLPVRTGPAVPTDLIGLWELNQQSESNGVHSLDNIRYNFAAPDFKMLPTGTYFYMKLHGSAQGRCLVQSGQKEFGQIFVLGSTITLTPQQRLQTSRNTCTGKNEETPMDLTRTEYQYKIDRQPTGWTLCLSDRFGQTCLSPHKP